MDPNTEIHAMDQKSQNAGVETLDMAVADTQNNADAIRLAQAGKKQVLTRRFGLVSMIGFTAGLMCTWEGMLAAFVLGLTNGGPAGLIYGFFVAWIGTLSVSIVMGELASMMPTAGGQYHWIALLSPKYARRFLSYVTGWLTIVGWVCGTTAAAFSSSSMIQGLFVLNIDGYEPKRWQNTLLLWALLILALMINTILSKALPTIEVFVLILHVLGFFTIIVPLAYLAPTTNTGAVFTTFRNGGGWNTQALSFFIGLIGNVSAFVGTDGPIHMSEEVQNSTVNVPRAMIASIMLNGVLAFGMLLTVLFHAGSIDDALKNAPNGFPFIRIFALGTGSNAAATAMTTIISTMSLCAATGGLAAASRMMWSFARDRGVPGHRTLSKVNRRTTIPLAAVLVVFTCAFCLGFINIGNTTVFNALFSMTAESFYTSYLIACGLLLYRRLRGEIREPDTDIPSENAKAFEWGPWRLKGVLGIANNILACCYLILIAFFSLWPTSKPVTAKNMNYSVLVTGGVTLFSIIYYYVWAKKSYHGPVVEVRVPFT